MRKRLAEKYDSDLGYLLAGKPDIFNRNRDVKAQASLMPYDKTREIPRASFEVGDQIGSGNFGTVHKGIIKEFFSTTSKAEVAIKSISGHVGEQEVENFLYEIKIMSYIKPHINLVSLIGACTSEFDKNKEMWLVIEFCEHGDLRTFMVENMNKIKLGEESEKINSRCLVLWLYDIAKGMQYLSENFIMHGDLAARNILLDENPLNGGHPVAKVADFGLSKQLYGDTKYEKQNRTMIPWKWMALELLKNDYLTLRSDVWSFGVLLWEIFSFGRAPYGHVDYEELLNKLENGYRLPCPPDVTNIIGWSPENLYNNLSKVCFEEDPNERASFVDVVGIIENELSEEDKNRYTQMCETYENTHAVNYLKVGTK